MPMPSLHVYIITLHDALSTTNLGRLKSIARRRKDDNLLRIKMQDVDMIGTQKANKGKGKIEAHKDLLGEGGKKVEST